jgi:hypothetical protein
LRKAFLPNFSTLFADFYKAFPSKFQQCNLQDVLDKLEDGEFHTDSRKRSTPGETDEGDTGYGYGKTKHQQGRKSQALVDLFKKRTKVDDQVYAVDQQDQTQVAVTFDPTDQPTQFPILVTEDGKRLPRDEKDMLKRTCWNKGSDNFRTGNMNMIKNRNLLSGVTSQVLHTYPFATAKSLPSVPSGPTAGRMKNEILVPQFFL